LSQIIPGLENAEDIAQIKKTRDKNKNGLTQSHKERKEKKQRQEKEIKGI